MTDAAQSFVPCSDSLPAMMDFVALRAGALGLPQAVSLRLQLVAEELFTNTFRHAPCTGTHPPVTLRIAAAPGEEAVELVYEDGEAEWNPLAHLDSSHLERPLAERPVGGLGVLLVQSLAERVEYERANGRNRLRARFRRAPEK